MNRMKQTLALLLAIVLVLGVALPLGIGGVFGKDAEQTTPIEEEAAEPEGEAEPGEEATALSFYEQLMACGSLSDFDDMLRAAENTAAFSALSQEELTQLLDRVEAMYAATDEPTEADTLLKEKVSEKLNENMTTVCPECGEADGHAETCSKYTAEPVNFPWTNLTDTELAAWLMDEANADTVKAILSGDGEEYDDLNSRIDKVLSGEDAELAQQVQEYLSELMGMDEPEALETTINPVPGAIYFDLALGDVEIGKPVENNKRIIYSGYVNVGGNATLVTGDHKDTNQYYIYQSTDANRSETGYKTEDELKAGSGCRVPVYPRVTWDGKSWTEYIENNANVEEVSENWEKAAVEANRKPIGEQKPWRQTSTGKSIIFGNNWYYTANVIIDNIWTYYQEPGQSRWTGGITARLDWCNGTKLNIQLKGDNRVGNIHYSNPESKNNQIIFSNGDEENTPGSLTVADFPKDFKKNYWCAAIGGQDDPGYGHANGIVIESGVIYAGTTSADDCTAIGGGGNEFGGVTISGGTVTAVSASTGTAIGGGIGWGDKGGDANVTISGGTVYAYNHGIGPNSGDYVSFVPAAAIGGGSASTNKGNDRTTVTITGGTVYAQSVSGAAIGGGGSGNNVGGSATVNITGGTVIAKSIGGEVTYEKNVNNTKEVVTETVSHGASIGGGTGFISGGTVKLNISGKDTTLRTGSIGGGKATGSGYLGNIGSANVTISGGDITGQVVMAGGQGTNCSFTMTDGRIHGTNVTEGNTIADIFDPNQKAKIEYIEKNGGAVWMQDPKGKTEISGGTIEDCTAELGGAVYMEGGTASISGGTINGCTAELGGAVYMKPSADGKTSGTFHLSKDGKLIGNIAKEKENNADTGLGGAVYISGGTVQITGGSLGDESAPNKAKDGAGVYVNGGTANVSSSGTVQYNEASQNGGGVYVTGGTVNVSGGFIKSNKAGNDSTSKVGSGGGVYLTGGTFTMTNGEITDNVAHYRGGGIFLTSSPELTGGTISGNKATESGGGLCVSGAGVELKNPEMKIFGNHAANGGGVAVLNGTFTLNGGAVGVKDGISQGDSSKANTAINGGGVYVAADSSSGSTSKADAIVTAGNVWYNSAKEGGGIYLAKSEGDFTLRGESAVISHNIATENGGGIYLYKDPILDQGSITNNTATNDGGGMYIEDCLVTLNPTSDVYITENNAKNGAGIYIHRLTGESGSTEPPAVTVDAVTRGTPEPDHKVGLHVAGDKGTVYFTENTATENGGGVCVAGGYFVLESDKISMTKNHAVNGGGVAVRGGNFTMTKGAVGANDGANTATNGGGVYVADGQVWLKGGSVQYNTATSGGGAYVIGGANVTGDQFIMINGSLKNNTATENGGGAYVAGNFHMLGGTVGGVSGGNHAKKGGGVYVSEGNVTVVYGDISHNYATENGGGFFVSASLTANTTGGAVRVKMLSGSLSSNRADQNGGGMAVESTEGKKIKVEIGCLLDHNIQNSAPTLPIQYEGETYGEYANFDNIDYQHGSCPVVRDNNAKEIGGGFYMNSDDSTLSFYCVDETNNTAEGSDSTAGMDVVGGTVIIGDYGYHNVNHGAGTTPKQVKPRGYISMDDATLVNGGTVDIYGDMDNPIFRNEVTVDITDTVHDHFFDHRRVHESEKSYKVHYIENFDGGLYQAFQYNEGETEIVIDGALYSHEGYEIIGWYTQAEYDPNTVGANNRFYKVGEKINLAALQENDGMGTHSIACNICGENTADSNLLELYAIWEPIKYTVVFDPNVPEGKTYTGTMADQQFVYDKELKALSENKYKYPGNFFKGWSTKPVAGSEDHLIEDGADGSRLTGKNGDTVVLYAQWDPCDHTVPERWTYDVVDDGKTLRRICSCGGQTLKASLSAENTVYDGNPHPAKLTLDDPAAWGDDAPAIVYTPAWLVNDGISHDPDTAPVLSADKKPFHAGIYTASITKQNKKGDTTTDVKASVEYTIKKADQNPPAKPEYTVPENLSDVVIKKLNSNSITDEANRVFTAEAEYRLSYYINDTLTYTPWKKAEGTGNKISIAMENAWTSYNVEARYQELEDYNPSEVVRADAVYHFTGNVTVKIICDIGIDAYFQAKLNETDQTLDGATLTLTTQKEYYLVGGKYTVTAEIQGENETNSKKFESITEGEDTGGKKNYSITNVPDNSTLTITIGKARKKPVPDAQVAPKQIFSTLTNTETTTTTISRDSAFTAAFQISNYDPVYTRNGKNYGAYTGVNLTFGDKIPKNTTIILLDRKDNSYWYYCANSEANSVALTNFKKMGESGTLYSIPQPAQENGYVDLSYQFIVDFSQVNDGYTGTGLTMNLEAEKASDSSAPEVKPSVTVNMSDSQFTFETTGTSGLTNSFKCSFNAGVPASKWDDRASALILTPTSNNLPPDAQIKAEVVGGGNTYLYNKSDGSFIVPLSLLKTGEKTVNLTLESALFPKERASYTFEVQWVISPSEAGKAPKSGYGAVEIENVTFTSANAAAPSLKPTGTDRVLTAQDTLKLTINKENIGNGYTISADLLRKEDGGTAYIGTGWNEQSVTGDSLSVPLGGQKPGSFCLMLTVWKDSKVVMEVPYYFVIKETE